ncbi:sensor domain-containing diguanylate cyclase [Sulfurimonas microaerophilic]|uniref:sensor domain-containing diguanylate cyclase n=1 Tax=Sulfurimonas microaerophilic TaxID=3058392 RepID=UPI002714F211|nr:sensor domain-containing diguanylate cyclase [Sulfurimonas sp. hsl 1-7]
MIYIILVLVFLIIFIYLRFRKQQQNLIEAKEKYKSIVEDLGENFFAYRMDADFNFVYFSKNMENILGTPPEDVLGKNFDNMLEWTGDSIEIGAKSLDAYYQGKQTTDLTMMSFIHPISKEERFIRVADHAVHDSSGNLLWIEGILEDITSRINAEKALQQKKLEFEKLATTDILTDVYNRYSIMKQIEEEINRIKRKEEFLSLIMYDFDHFKNVNDNFGHDVGDYVLKETTKVISGVIREIDKIGRYGGEEFLILLPFSNLSNALEVAERIRDAVASHHFKDVGHITISLGVVEYKKDESRKSLLKRVDEKMYESKHSGRNKISS